MMSSPAEQAADAEPTDRSIESARLPWRRYWLTLYRRDVGAAERLLDDMLARHRPQTIYLRLFEPALNLSGTLFAMGRIHYRDEHFVTHHTQRLMRRVRRKFVPREPTGPLALAMGVGQESHLIGLRMVCDFLQHANWQIHWMTSNDRGHVGEIAQRLQPAAVLLSIGLAWAIEPARRLIADLRRRRYAGLVAVGGRIVNEDQSIVQHVGADLTASNGLHLVRILRPRFVRREIGDGA